jgi:hypothetical protein
VVETLVGVAESGNVDAMNLLGVLYTTGTQVPRDTSMALYWFQKAIDGGSADAMDNLATMYLFGIGLSRDPVNALRWYVRSAARGNVHSIYSVAVMAEKGSARAATYSLLVPCIGERPSPASPGHDSGERGLMPADRAGSVTWSKRTHGCRSRCNRSSRRSCRSRRSPAWRSSRRVSRRSAVTMRAERATALSPLVKTRALPAERKAPTAMHFSSL